MGLVGLVRAEFLRARNFDYVRSAKAMVPMIMFRHILPNAMSSPVAVAVYFDGKYHGTHHARLFGLWLACGVTVFGELIHRGKIIWMHRGWLWQGVGLTIVLSLLIFIGEALRDAFDPRQS